MSTEPPPLYTKSDNDEGPSTSEGVLEEPDDPQILIIPPSQSAQFQKGFLGADDERAAIEGELQIKGISASACRKVYVHVPPPPSVTNRSCRTVSLRSVETAFNNEVELYKSEVVLFSRTPSTQAVPSSFPFAIPLTPDTPQCLATIKSSIVHTLTATVLPTTDLPVLSKSILVQPRRYTSHSHILQVSPVTRTLDTPTRVEVQVPRTAFRSDEVIPVYVTIPSPRRELVVDDGVRLRNIRAELVRVIKVKTADEKADRNEASTRDEKGFDFDSDIDDDFGPELNPTTSSTSLDNKPSSSSSQLKNGWTMKTIVTRSGAGCRFHSSLPIRQRLVLHQPLESPYITPVEFPQTSQQNPEQELECPLITQTTVLHSVTFRLLLHTTFVNMAQRTEQVHTILIPILLIPPVAPLPQVDEELDTAYRKKHDQPPPRTIRGDDTENTPNYEEAGPSYSGAPPPFEEREAPPPFSDPEASSSSRLPTFLEAETEIYAPSSEDSDSLCEPEQEFAVSGEGTLFGFHPSEQFDGHMLDVERRRSSTPPPTMEMATKDPDVTDLASMDQPELAMEALGLALERHEEVSTSDRSSTPPPPPLIVDDPSDPPPSIDSDFSDAQGMARQPPPPAPSHSPPPPPPPPAVVHDGHAPPPYLIPDNHHHDGTGPPPYIDVMHPSQD
jgi:hypothetical protein